MNLYINLKWIQYISIQRISISEHTSSNLIFILTNYIIIYKYIYNHKSIPVQWFSDRYVASMKSTIKAIIAQLRTANSVTKSEPVEVLELADANTAALLPFVTKCYDAFHWPKLITVILIRMNIFIHVGLLLTYSIYAGNKIMLKPQSIDNGKKYFTSNNRHSMCSQS